MNKTKFIRRKIKGALRMVKYFKNKKDTKQTEHQQKCADAWIAQIKEG